MVNDELQLNNRVYKINEPFEIDKLFSDEYWIKRRKRKSELIEEYPIDIIEYETEKMRNYRYKYWKKYRGRKRIEIDY